MLEQREYDRGRRSDPCPEIVELGATRAGGQPVWRRVKWRVLVVALGVSVILARPAQAQVLVHFQPALDTVSVGSDFTVDLVADLPNPILGWGLDVSIVDDTILSFIAPPQIGPLWSAATSPDGDDLAGLSFPQGVSGMGILLATLSFSADAVGETDLAASYDVTDLSEGFALDPFGFDTVTFDGGHVMVTPEPGIGTMLAFFVVAGPWRIKRRHRR